jgi:YYY domain-containing protein
MFIERSPSQEIKQHSFLFHLVVNLALILILAGGAYLRFVGIDWGEYTFMHPDERFLLLVSSDIQPVRNLGEYFDTAASTLNPHNRGHGFYVYGTLPLFLARYATELFYDFAGLMELTDVGRSLSALSDFFTVMLVFAITRRLYGNAAALLAAAFSALSVLNIQQSHYFTMDTFTTLFSTLAIYFAVRVLCDGKRRQDRPGEKVSGYAARPFAPSTLEKSTFSSAAARFAANPMFGLSVGFGAALGMAVASKVNAVPVAMMLPLAVGMVLLALPPHERQRQLGTYFLYLATAAAVSIVVFRLFQPYAFSGPGFFGVAPNPSWVANLREQRFQAAGDLDFPPAMQWARRPVWFSFQNMVLWGMGLPFGIIAWAGFLWMGWRIFTGNWRPHLLLWGWTAFYFIWQSLQFNPTMRYQMPIYPTLAVIAGWTIVSLYRRGLESAGCLLPGGRMKPAAWKLLAVIAGSAAVLGTAAWAFAFSRIYVEPFTRAEASHWIFQNLPGPLTLPVETGSETYNQIVSYPYGYTFQPDSPYYSSFQARSSGLVQEIIFPYILDQLTLEGSRSLSLVISALPYGDLPLANAQFEALDDGPFVFILDQSIPVAEEETYYLTLYGSETETLVDICGPMALHIRTPEAIIDQGLPQPASCLIRGTASYSAPFTVEAGGFLEVVSLEWAREVDAPTGQKTIKIEIRQAGDPQLLAGGTLTGFFTEEENQAQVGYRLRLDRPLQVLQDQFYEIFLSVEQGQGAITLMGTAIANEGDWDDGLPVRIYPYEPFGGIYQPGLEFHMYRDDNPEKLERFLRVLEQAEYLVISSNRQWGSLPRIPERFPLVTSYYRNLLGCPIEISIQQCYNVADVGIFQGNLGFELVMVFQSDPYIGPLRINTQFAEEAFTVYDHPKVFIFRKTADYDPERVQAILGKVDFSQVIRLTPKRAPSHPADLMLPAARLQEQQQGGTWSDIFDTGAIHNRSQLVGALVWYLALALLGWAAYPLVRLGLSGLSDRGYPLARTAGLVIFTYLAWGAGSLRLPFSQTTLLAAFVLIAVVGLVLGYLQRDALKRELRERGRYYLAVEGLFLAFFLVGLLVRLGNPDLWHPFRGGEKPMDFAYFNAILKSTSFPPYDPWFAGGYLNYYYYGFVLVGSLTKLLAIVPAFAYNLILPTIFMLMAMGAFSAAWNLYKRSPLIDGPAISNHEISDPVEDQTGLEANAEQESEPGILLPAPVSQEPIQRGPSPYLIGLLAAFLMTILGNLGTVRMIWRGYQILGAPGGLIDDADIFTRMYWAVLGLVRAFSGERLPYSLGDWYWIPSRTIPPQGDVEPITEFPFFTFLYGDPHAHLFALPVTLLALGFALAVVFGKLRWPKWQGAATGFLLGALAIGALYPINLSDIYTYLPLGLVAISYAAWRYYDAGRAGWLPGFPLLAKRLLVVIGASLLLAALAFLLYQPYRTWYGQAYSSVDLWRGPTTPSSSYFTHWGLFLFLFAAWLAWETREWMANTPLSALGKLEPYRVLIRGGLLVLVLTVALLVWTGIHIAWIVLPLAVWAGILLLRPGSSDSWRAVLFLFGTGLAITLMVEMVVVRGDIGRMNTVFKFYLQVWTLFAVAGAVATGWLVGSFRRWSRSWLGAWQVAFVILLAFAALFTLLGGTARIKDRMASNTPLTLDGMAYMQYSVYDNLGTLIDLNQDYHAIRWMQENVSGSPVIVEAASPNQYAWFSRFSIYTGLPAVVGWEWHQIQQRALLTGDWVRIRVNEVGDFYQTRNIEAALGFLEKYNVQYIVVGQVERGYYSGAGLNKFSSLDGQFWKSVYEDRDTVIYEVLR